MLLARKLDDKAITLYKQNKSFFHIGCAGHEAVQIAAAKQLVKFTDYSYPYYRDLAFVLALGMTPEEIMLNVLSKADDPNSGGRQMPMHYGHKGLKIVSQSSPTGTQFLQAVGTAHAAKFRGDKSVVYCSSGEGTTAQGCYHEALNWAAKEKLPVVFVIQDNHFAISVPIADQLAGASVAKISRGYEGLHVEELDGLNYLESERILALAFERARSGNGPTVIDAQVVRLQSHSISDNQLKYREQDELEIEKLRDPLLLLSNCLKEKGVSLDHLEKISAEIIAQVNQAADWAEQQADPAVRDLTKHIFVDSYPSAIAENVSESGLELFLVDALNQALDEELKRNPEMLCFGEDIASGKGGVFTVTTGLTAKHGEDRVFNSPLAEDSIVGTAIGMALTGLKPVVEIQFGDYIWPAMMQIRNELATMNYRSNGSWTCPITIRVPVGGYIRGGLYHSQNIETFFAHTPGLVVILPSNARDAKGLLKSAIRSNDPVLFLEHKNLYRQVFAKAAVGGPDDLIPIGVARIARSGEDLTIVTYGALVQKSIVAAQNIKEKYGKQVEVIDLRTLRPLDTTTIVQSLKKTGRLLVVYEDQKFLGFGTEVISIICEEAFEFLDAPPKRVCGKDVFIPQAPLLEHEALPQISDIVSGIEDLLRY